MAEVVAVAEAVAVAEGFRPASKGSRPSSGPNARHSRARLPSDIDELALLTRLVEEKLTGHRCHCRHLLQPPQAFEETTRGWLEALQ